MNAISSSIYKQIKEIIKEDKVRKEVDYGAAGDWEIIYTDGSKLYLSIFDYLDPTVNCLISTIIVGKNYTYDDLFEVKDCKGGNKVKPSKLKITPSSVVIHNEKERELVFSRPYEEGVRFNFTIFDKISGKEPKEVEYKIRVTHPQKTKITNSNNVILSFGRLIQKEIKLPTEAIPDDAKIDMGTHIAEYKYIRRLQEEVQPRIEVFQSGKMEVEELLSYSLEGYYLSTYGFALNSEYTFLDTIKRTPEEMREYYHIYSKKEKEDTEIEKLNSFASEIYKCYKEKIYQEKI